MNTKMTFAPLALILACSASAQMTAILPGGRGNLYIGRPTTLPGPTSNFVINQRIRLPAPLLTPPVALTPAPRKTTIPVLAVAMPLRTVRFAAPAQGAAPAQYVIAARGKLDTVFDGRHAY